MWSLVSSCMCSDQVSRYFSPYSVCEILTFSMVDRVTYMFIGGTAGGSVVDLRDLLEGQFTFDYLQ